MGIIYKKWIIYNRSAIIKKSKKIQLITGGYSPDLFRIADQCDQIRTTTSFCESLASGSPFLVREQSLCAFRVPISTHHPVFLPENRPILGRINP